MIDYVPQPGLQLQMQNLEISPATFISQSFLFTTLLKVVTVSCGQGVPQGCLQQLWHIRDSVQVFQKTFVNSTEMYSHICGKFLTNQNTETR